MGARDVFKFVDHNRRARKRALKILNTKKEKQQKKPYEDSLQVTHMSLGYANDVVQALRLQASVFPLFQEAADNAAEELENVVSLANKVISQTERRVLYGEKAPAKEKFSPSNRPDDPVLS